MAEKEIGVVTHYFSHLGVAALNLIDDLDVGDTIRIKGRTTDLTMTVESMQIEHRSVNVAKPGDDVAIMVSEHVREHDVVLKLVQ
ncbi:MAG: translation elongation factor-like protein [Chloroflexi bacterium]|nr:translation elongation factor-like protein [Chloroflexota bacterium]